MAHSPEQPQDNELPIEPPIEPAHAFAADLKAAYAERIDVPASLDAAILDAARRAEPDSLPIRRWHWRVAGAAAIVIFAAALGSVYFNPPPAGQPLAGDVDGSNTVDIIDALAIAQLLRDPSATVPIQWDVTGDGVVDRADVEAVARQAVALPQSPNGQPSSPQVSAIMKGDSRG